MARQTLEEMQQALAQARRAYAAHAWEHDAPVYRRRVEELSNLVASSTPPVVVLEVQPVREAHHTRHENPCRQVYGPGPEDKQCCDCVRLHTISFWSGRTVYKCDLRKLTRGRGSDHGAKYPTCGRFVEGQGPVHSIDPR